MSLYLSEFFSEMGQKGYISMFAFFIYTVLIEIGFWKYKVEKPQYALVESQKIQECKVTI